MEVFGKIVEDSDVGIKVGMGFIRKAIIPEEL